MIDNVSYEVITEFDIYMRDVDSTLYTVSNVELQRVRAEDDFSCRPHEAKEAYRWCRESSDPSSLFSNNSHPLCMMPSP